MREYISFTDEQKHRANAVDLEDFLLRRGERLISSGHDKRLASDHSVTICGSEWYDHEVKKGGHAIDFVRMYDGCSFQEAVTKLMNGEQGQIFRPAKERKPEPPKPFALPPAHHSMRRVYAYLMKQAVAATIVAAMMYQLPRPAILQVIHSLYAHTFYPLFYFPVECFLGITCKLLPQLTAA